jgi:predicted RNase H-like HicB family nuclease
MVATKPADEPRYTITIEWSAEDACFVAKIPTLPGCIAVGDSRYEALDELRDAMHAWIRVCEEAGNPVPEPP